MAEFASKGVAGSGLGLGIAGTALGLLNGGFGNIFRIGSGNCHENMPVNRYELSQESKIAKLETEVALRDASIYTDKKIADVYERLDSKIRGVEAGLNAQAVYNATNTATINCIQGQVAQLFGLTKLVIPNTSVCPGWGEAKVSISTTTTGA